MGRIFSVSGLIGSGKDTVANYLIREHGFVKDSFAATLKDAVSVMFGWDRAMLEGATPEARAEREKVDEWWANRLGIPKLTPRWVLQVYGTEVIRRNLHDDFWVATVERRLANTDADVVLTDARFPNELVMLRKLGAVMTHVDRGPRPDWWYTAVSGNLGNKENYNKMMLQSAVHPSEWSWPGFNFDAVLDNNSSLEHLYNQVRRQLSVVVK